MKQLTSYNRVAGYLNKLFDLLNDHYFENALVRPTITIQSTPRAYGHFSMRNDTWVSVTGNSNEINIGAGTLARPIENVCATLLHEMVHYYCHVNGIKDTSRGNTYHNKRFKETAESHGLIIEHHAKYGWTVTSPSLELLDFIELQGWQAIQMTEGQSWQDMIGTGTGSRTPGAANGGAVKPPKRPSSTRRWICPKCGTIIRSTKDVRVICADCMELFVKAD